MENIIVKNIQTQILDIPIKRPHQFSAVKVTSKSFVLVRVELNNGVVGIGEGTTPGVFWNGETVETMKIIIDKYITPLLLEGNAVFLKHHMARIAQKVRGNNFAKATIEMALFDALGKSWSVPVHQLLGGLYQERIPVRWALASGTPEGDIEEGKASVNEGRYQSFKTKSGKEKPEYDTQRSIDIAQGLKGHATLGIDPNGRWDRLTTTKWMGELWDSRIDFLEQPLAPSDIEGMAHLVAMKKVPIMADESVSTIEDALRAVKHQAANIFSLKIHKSGGMINTLKIAGIAEAEGISCFGGTSLESSIGTAASLHTFASVPNLDYGSELFGPDWLSDDIVKNPFTLKDGTIHVPHASGLGIELDEQKVDTYTREGVM